MAYDIDPSEHDDSYCEMLINCPGSRLGGGEYCACSCHENNFKLARAADGLLNVIAACLEANGSCCLDDRSDRRELAYALREVMLKWGAQND